MISKAAVDAYLHKQLNNYLWMKRLKVVDFLDEYKHYKVKPHFKTTPWLNQHVMFHLAMCNPFFLFFYDMGTGKALPVHEDVLTPTGYRPIGALKVGDSVIGKDGKATKVTGVYPQGVKQIFNIRFSDGADVNCSTEHLWAVQSPAQKNKGYDYKVVEAHELYDDLRFKQSGSSKGEQGNRKWFIPMAAPVEFSSTHVLELHPYTLGVLLGDGSVSGDNCGVCCHKDDVAVIERAATFLPEGVRSVPYKADSVSGDVLTFGFSGSSGKLKKILRNLGVATTAHFKHIPEHYKFASIEDRKELLAGLLDTDGWCESGGAVGFCSVSSVLAHEVKDLIHTLGGTAKLKRKVTEECESWHIYARLPFVPFKLERKYNKCAREMKLKPYRSIEAMELIGDSECVCISVEASDGLFLARSAVVTHNTKGILDIITQVQREGNLKRALVTVNGKLTIDSWDTAIQVHSDLHPIIIDCEDIEEKFERLISPKGDIAIIDYPSLHHALGKKVKKNGKHVLMRDDKKVEQVMKLYNFYNGDESHKIKNTDTLRYAIISKLTKHMDYRYLMTGTPMGKNPEDVFSQFYLADRGETFGDTLGMFRAGFFIEKQHQWKGVEYIFDSHKERLFHKFMQHKSLRYADTECNDIPQCNEIPVPIEFCSEQREHYLRAVEGLINAGGKLNQIDNNYHKMRQAVAGFLKWEDDYGAHIIKFKRNNKLDWIEEFLSDVGDSKVVISHEYRESARIIEERLTKLGIGFESVRGGTKDPVAAVTRFKQDPSKRVFLMNSEAGGTGTDGLQAVARYLVFYESPTSSITRKQVIKRVYRAGQQYRTFVYNLMLKGSIDKKVLDDVNEGRDTHETLVNGKFNVKSFLLFDV